MNTEVCPNTTMPGGMISLSANGNQEGTAIIWAVYPSANEVIRHMCDASEPGQPSNRVLAFDAETLRVLWQTNLPGRSHFIPPTIADGQVLLPAGAKFLIYELNR